MENVTLNQYKGTIIEKGFQNNEVDELKAVLALGQNFNKGLIDEELLEKALPEISQLNQVLSEGDYLTLDNGKNLVKSIDGWILEKAKTEEKEEEEEETEEEEMEKAVSEEKEETKEDDEEGDEAEEEESETEEGEEE